jgi:hypothetical protein
MTLQQIQDCLLKIDWGVIIGLIALVFTAISLQVQRKHNRLSVKPIAIISVGDFEDELAVHLQNKGTGPLIIKSLSFSDQNGRTEKAIINFFGSDYKNIVWSMFIADIDGWSILPSETKTLIMFKGDSANKEFIHNRDRIRKVLAQIRVEVLYQDIYGNNMSKKTRKLDWFARKRTKVPINYRHNNTM